MSKREIEIPDNCSKCPFDRSNYCTLYSKSNCYGDTDLICTDLTHSKPDWCKAKSINVEEGEVKKTCRECINFDADFNFCTSRIACIKGELYRKRSKPVHKKDDDDYRHKFIRTIHMIGELIPNCFDPDDIFTKKRLTEWAEDNGWVKEGK